MIEFGKKKKAASPAKTDGNAFLTQAKADHQALFESYVTVLSEYDTAEEFVAALHNAAWELTEQVAKKSYRNGINRGRQR